MPFEPLQERDANIPSLTKMHTEQKAQHAVQQHTATAKTISDKRPSNSYVSPSDSVLSPATQKLAAFKNKHLNKGVKPQNLFARASPMQRAAANRAASASNLGFVSIDQTAQKEKSST